jgi:hypothetical protein
MYASPTFRDGQASKKYDGSNEGCTTQGCGVEDIKAVA